MKWFKEEEEIVTTTVETYEVVEFEDTVTLIIKSAKPENTGNYYAQLINEAGQISSNKAQLTVKCNLLFLEFIIFHSLINFFFQIILKYLINPTMSYQKLIKRFLMSFLLKDLFYPLKSNVLKKINWLKLIISRTF